MGEGPAGSSGGDKGLSMSVFQTLRLAWADADLRARIIFVLGMFAVYALGIHVQVPIPGIRPEDLTEQLKSNPYFNLINMFGGGALKRLSIFALGLNPYITASIILQILTQANPKWKIEMREGGEYARRAQNKRTRLLSIVLCVAQGWGFLQMIMANLPSRAAFTPFVMFTVLLFWTAGAMFVLWLGEQISERGIGNGVSLMIFAGIIISLPNTVQLLYQGVRDHQTSIFSVLTLLVLFLVTTWTIVFFTVAQRRIPVQHMRRVQGTRQVGGQTSYLPLSVNMAGVIPIIFAISLIYLPQQFGSYAPGTKFQEIMNTVNTYINPGDPTALLWQIVIASIMFSALIFFFTYFYTAIQYNVDDIADNLKRGGSFIPGVRPGKQTSDFLNGVISRITVVGAAFLAVVSLIQFLAPRITGTTARISVIGGSTLLIMVSVALETMRQIEANLLMKRYNA
ncbi:MAG TPA: preprotein translocase subunit SecY [Fimbriimonadaceae bacterium]|nr:preprotein translocase subunit SecY [Fimbriimonadaceae bacterium]